MHVSALTPQALVLWAVLVLPCAAHAQDPQFSQLNAAPMYVNPALVGSSLSDRFMLVGRKQWPGTLPGYDTYFIEYDRNLRYLKSGMGFHVLHDRAGTTGLAFTQCAAAYAYHVRLNLRAALRFGMRAAYTWRGYDASQMRFADQIIRENASVSVEDRLYARATYTDMAFGMVYYTEVFWAGLSLNHLNRPDHALVAGTNTRMPVRTSIVAGYKFALDGAPAARSLMLLSINAQYRTQGAWDQADLGLQFDHDRLLCLVMYRGLPGMKAYAPGAPNDDALVIGIGYKADRRFRFMHSYDMTMSRLSMRSSGAHELSILYEIPSKKRKRRVRMVACPIF